MVEIISPEMALQGLAEVIAFCVAFSALFAIYEVKIKPTLLAKVDAACDKVIPK